MFELFRTAYRKDPSLRGGFGLFEVLFYPGVQAIILYRISHFLHNWGVPVIPRAISYFGRFLTGAEIHPNARIGRRFFIDHATGVVIGETARVGDDVMLYQGVTLGGHGWWRDVRGEKRHPTIEDNCVIGVGATILGPVVVKKNSRIGALAVIVDDIPEDSTVVCPKGRLRVMEGCYIRLKDPCDACIKEPEWII
jgi:serine O-acetyltransferase